MKKLRDNHRGFTLLEVAIATGIFGFLMVSLMSMGIQSSIFTKRIDQTYRSSFVSQVQINSMKMLDYGNLSSAEESGVRVSAFGEADSNGRYLRTTEVEAAYNGDSNLTKIKISVNSVKINMDGSIANPVVYLGDPVVFETLFVNADVSVSDDENEDEDEHNDTHEDDDGDGECDEHEDADGDDDCDDSHDAHDDHHDNHNYHADHDGDNANENADNHENCGIDHDADCDDGNNGKGHEKDDKDD